MIKMRNRAVSFGELISLLSIAQEYPGSNALPAVGFGWSSGFSAGLRPYPAEFAPPFATRRVGNLDWP
jgi:hypothetical protein